MKKELIIGIISILVISVSISGCIDSYYNDNSTNYSSNDVQPIRVNSTNSSNSTNTVNLSNPTNPNDVPAYRS
jgi:hypothetical protein